LSLFHKSLLVNFVDWSVVLILDHSVAEGESEEGLALLVLVWLNVGGLVLSELGVLNLLQVAGEGCEDLGLLDLSVLEEQIEGGLSDWDDLLDHIPEDAL
jgi:hypothetical protein